MTEPVYRRVIVKLSGEALSGAAGFGIDQPTLDRIAEDLIATTRLGVQVGVVVGGGNIFRGVEVSTRGVSRATGDSMILSPPLIWTRNMIDLACERILKALDLAQADLQRAS